MYNVVKPLVDVLGAGIGLIVTAPLQAVLAVLVLRKLGRPIFFRQRRAGLHGKPFTIVKFRTMHAPEPCSTVLADADRLTPFGTGLRRLSLDELPTLWNVFTGDMSFVGPRPLLMEYLDRYTHEQARRHEVRPGITGLAQVSGRNCLTWEQKFSADIDYINRRSLALDVRIVGRTVASVARCAGISAAGNATMPEFMGSLPRSAPE